MTDKCFSDVLEIYVNCALLARQFMLCKMFLKFSRLGLISTCQSFISASGKGALEALVLLRTLCMVQTCFQ